jgi:hypothetical protein
MHQQYRRVDDDLRHPYFQMLVVWIHRRHLGHQMKVLRFLGDMEIRPDELHLLNLVHQLILVDVNLDLQVDVLQNLDEQNLDVRRPYLDVLHQVQDVLLDEVDVVQVVVALVGVALLRQLRMDYFQHVVDVEDYLLQQDLPQVFLHRGLVLMELEVVVRLELGLPAQIDLLEFLIGYELSHRAAR